MTTLRDEMREQPACSAMDNPLVIANRLGRVAAKNGLPCEPPNGMLNLAAVAWRTGWRDAHSELVIERKIRAEWFK